MNDNFGKYLIDLHKGRALALAATSISGSTTATTTSRKEPFAISTSGSRLTSAWFWQCIRRRTRPR